MLFSSTVFVFLFLPIVNVFHFLVPWRARNLWLLAASLFFYAWGETHLVWILLVSIFVNYLSALAISGGFSPGTPPQLPQAGGRTARQKLALAVGILANLGLLGFFKYFHFGVDTWNQLLALAGIERGRCDPGFTVTLPLGISFFTFQAMSYTIDVYRGRARATRNLLNLATYVTLFPQLVAGPIVRYVQVAEALKHRKPRAERIARGSKRFVVGLAKKMIVANAVAVPADQIFALPDNQLTSSLAWLAVLCYTLQIYFDFSGYSDMAIGMGHIFGFDFPENFNYPYIAQSMRDFWQRWHISLSTWFRDYLYIPLGGNRKGAFRTRFNLLLVFLLCGLWHGASWTFVVWGLYHGFFLALERTPFGVWVARLWRPLRHAYTLLAVMIGWIVFRAETFKQALMLLKATICFAGAESSVHVLSEYCDRETVLIVGLAVLGSMPWIPAAAARLRAAAARMHPLARASMEVTAEAMVVPVLCLLFAYCAMLLAAQTHNPFIYFRF